MFRIRDSLYTLAELERILNIISGCSGTAVVSHCSNLLVTIPYYETDYLQDKLEMFFGESLKSFYINRKTFTGKTIVAVVNLKEYDVDVLSTL